MNRNIAYAIIVSVGLFANIACSSDKGSDVSASNDTELTISGVNDKEWTYVSLGQNKVIGKSSLGNPKEDAAWHDRTDWDLAICGDMIKTNSGTSGIGKGGLTRLDGVDYDKVEASSAYLLDEDRQESPD